jgi:hypothetical protein
MNSPAESHIATLGPGPTRRPVVLDRGDRDGDDAVTWLAANRAELTRLLRTEGAVYMRDAGVDSAEHLSRAAAAMTLRCARYIERTSPRRSLRDDVYTATSYPAEYGINFHNELSYSQAFPEVIAFACVTPPATGGETPISDVRAMMSVLPDNLVRDFETSGYRYLRNFDEELGLPWRLTFGVETRDQLQRYCDEHAIGLTWKTPEWLQTMQVREATRIWHQTGERVWFNHAAFFHLASIPSEIWADLGSIYPADALPNMTTFGDGRAIPDAYVSTVNHAYERCAWQAQWERGDIMILNNVLWAHGRRAFQGAREVLTVFGDLGLSTLNKESTCNQ